GCRCAWRPRRRPPSRRAARQRPGCPGRSMQRRQTPAQRVRRLRQRSGFSKGLSWDGSSPSKGAGSENSVLWGDRRQEPRPGPLHFSNLGGMSNTSVIARLTSKGQVTVPVAIRYALGLAPGDDVVFALEDGRGVFRRATGLDDLKAAFPGSPRAGAHSLERLLVAGDGAFGDELRACRARGARLR